MVGPRISRFSFRPSHTKRSSPLFFSTVNAGRDHLRRVCQPQHPHHSERLSQCRSMCLEVAARKRPVAQIHARSHGPQESAPVPNHVDNP